MEAMKTLGSLTSKQFSTLYQNLAATNEKAAETALYLRCAVDVELFALVYFPHYCTHSFSQFHTDLFETWVYGERAIRRCDGAPRGYAKSTFVSLIKSVHDICYKLEKFIVIFSNTDPQAVGKIKDIRAELLLNRRLISDYRISFPGLKPAATQFVVTTEKYQTMVQAFGAGAEIRGIRFGAHRPTKIILDDVEHSKEVYNEEIRQKYEDWYFQVVSKIGNAATNIHFIGTVLHQKSLLKSLSKNSSYRSKIYRAVISWSEREDLWDQWRVIYNNIENDNRQAEAKAFYLANETEMLKGTEVLWPEKEPYELLMREMEETGKRSFMQEKQNEPTGHVGKLFTKLHFYREVEEGLKIESTGVVIPWKNLQEQAFGALDPSTGQDKVKKGSLGDFACLASGYKDPKGRLFVHHDSTKRLSPTKQIETIFESHAEFNYNKFGIETNLYRNLLLPNIISERLRIEKETKQVIKLPFYDIENTENKEKRIFTLEPKVSHGWILFNRGLSQEFMNQVEEFPHGDHDDAPDTLHMLWNLVNNRYKVSPLSINAMGNH